MTKGASLTTIVEMCIKRFAREFNQGSDNQVWFEYDAQFRLLSRLSSELDPLPRYPGVVHAELPAKNGQRYDIAVLEKEVAQRIVKEAFCTEDWRQTIEEGPVGVVIEVALAWIDDAVGTGRPGYIAPEYRRRISHAINRLVNNDRNGQLKPGSTHYVIICCVTKQYDKARTKARIESVNEGKKWIKTTLKHLCKDTKITVKVYWVSDHKEDTRGWL